MVLSDRMKHHPGIKKHSGESLFPYWRRPPALLQISASYVTDLSVHASFGSTILFPAKLICLLRLRPTGLYIWFFSVSSDRRVH